MLTLFSGNIKKENEDTLRKLAPKSGDPGSPAQKAGLRPGTLPIKTALNELLMGGDIIMAAKGHKLDNEGSYLKFVHSLKVGVEVILTIFRGGKILNVRLEIVERPILPWDIR